MRTMRAPGVLAMQQNRGERQRRRQLVKHDRERHCNRETRNHEPRPERETVDQRVESDSDECGHPHVVEGAVLLLARVHHHETLEHVDEKEAEEDRRAHGRPDAGDRFGNHVKERRPEQHARAEREHGANGAAVPLS